MNLKEYLFVNDMSQIDFCKEVGLSCSYMSMIVNGRKAASKKTCKAIERATEGLVKAENVSRQKMQQF